jgi:hypothetical protein
MSIKFLDLHAQYRSIKSEIDEAVLRVLENSVRAVHVLRC